MSTRENIRLIARTPLGLIFNCTYTFEEQFYTYAINSWDGGNS